MLALRRMGVGRGDGGRDEEQRAWVDHVVRLANSALADRRSGDGASRARARRLGEEVLRVSGNCVMSVVYAVAAAERAVQNRWLKSMPIYARAPLWLEEDCGAREKLVQPLTRVGGCACLPRRVGDSSGCGQYDCGTGRTV